MAYPFKLSIINIQTKDDELLMANCCKKLYFFGLMFDINLLKTAIPGIIFVRLTTC